MERFTPIEPQNSRFTPIEEPINSEAKPVKFGSDYFASNSGEITKAEKFLKGAKDPIDAGAQMLYNALPSELVSSMDKINNYIAEKTGLVGKVPEGGMNQLITDNEKEYQAKRAAAGEDGIDGARLAGNIASTIIPASKIPIAATLPARIGIGAGTGAAFGTLQPVNNAGEGEGKKDFWGEKAKQALVGGAFGAVAPVVLSGVSRLISPKASTNPQLDALRQSGVQPTIGQALGGRSAAVEEKIRSVPIVGDMIDRARNQTLETFNKSAINKALENIGEKADEIGQEGVKKAGDSISKYYDDALSQIKGVPLDASFQSNLLQLTSMAKNLVPEMQKKFNKTVDDIVIGRASPNGSLLPEVYKKVDSEIGLIASRYAKSSSASEQELGDALAQMQNLLKQQMLRHNPHVAQKLKSADTAWASLVRIEGAAKSAKNNGGIFTPAQLNAAIQSADDSVRGRSVSRGTALMQGFGNAGQKVIGSKVPDSGTAGRIGWGAGLVGAGAVNWPVTVAVMGTGVGLYTRPVQNALVKLIADRPSSANSIAQMVRELSPVGAALSPLAYTP